MYGCRRLSQCLSLFSLSVFPSSPPLTDLLPPTNLINRVLDYGLAQHPDFLGQPEYVLALLDILLQLHDDQHYRGLCDRCALGGCVV